MVLGVQQDEREKFLESAKQDLATRISDTEKTLQDSTVEESSQTHVIGGATTELQFGVQDGGPLGVAVDNAYEELLKKSEVSGIDDCPIHCQLEVSEFWCICCVLQCAVVVLHFFVACKFIQFHGSM
jgi:hypothetical protein